MRRLPTIPVLAAPAVRPSPSCSPFAITSRLQPHLRPASNPNPQTPPIYRPFSHTPTISNSKSPFRLSSTPQSTPPPTEPDSEFPDNDGEYYSPYKPKRQWPPDMSKLSPKHQFRLERKYRRRSALKYARPTWTKATKLVQWGTIGFVIVYALLFMEWDERGGKPIEEFREYIFGTLKGAFSAPPSQASMRRSEESTRE